MICREDLYEQENCDPQRQPTPQRQYRPMSSGKMLARNMLIYGLGGVVTPFVGIKIIDLMITPLLSVIL